MRLAWVMVVSLFLVSNSIITLRLKPPVQVDLVLNRSSRTTRKRISASQMLDVVIDDIVGLHVYSVRCSMTGILQEMM